MSATFPTAVAQGARPARLTAMVYRDAAEGAGVPPVEIIYGPLTKLWGLLALGCVMVLAGLLVGFVGMVFAIAEGDPPVWVVVLVSLLMLGAGTACVVGFFRTTTSFRLTVDRAGRRLTVRRLRFGVAAEARTFDLTDVVDVSILLGSKKLWYDSGTSKDRPAGSVNLVSKDEEHTSITGGFVHGTEVHARTAEQLRDVLGLDASRAEGERRERRP